LPTKSDGSPYNLTEATIEQQGIIEAVLTTIINWMTNSPDYKPLRMTVSAGAGRGKSYLIHQLTAAIRKIFGRNDVVETSAFTGSAAYNIGGATCHSSFGISTMNPNNEMTDATRQRLLKQLRYTVAIFIDERGMLSSNILGAAERNVAQTCHGGGKQQLDWGGVPIVILWGDDYQLPPVNIGGKGKGAFYSLEYRNNLSATRRQNVELNGMMQFQSFAKSVYELTIHMRTDDDEFIQIQDRIRLGAPTDQDIQTLLSLNMHRQTNQNKYLIETDKGTMHIFTTRKRCSEFNTSNIIQQQSENNPVAMIKNKLSKKKKTTDNDISSIPKTTLLCRGAKVCIRGKNFNPKRGLFNGSIGTVIDIVYKQGENPNTSHFPHYVIVDFPSYIGISADPRHPTWIPIPTITTYNPLQIYCPLQLSYARTVHTFQGFQAGPTQNIKRIVCDAGTTQHEGLFPGLFYTALSRATTIGSRENRANSAIFFERLERERIDHLTTNAHNKTYALVQKRNKWIAYLNESARSIEITQDQSKLQNIIRMADVRYTQQNLEDVITR
jgi:ATP-dependent exoDNAse (exonuclease V) alpha subunit